MLCLGLVLIALAGALAPAAAAGPFDGSWGVTLNCPRTPKGVLGYVFHFEAQVKDGALRGQKGTKGEPASLTIDGTIATDGQATINADGVTNDTHYTLHNEHTGTPYKYVAVGTFTASHGDAHRTTGRTCDYTFVRQG
jgi:hypothetical protein